MQYKDVAPGYSRAQRRPVFPLAGIMRPFGLYPVQAMPLLAGETLDYATVQGRFISQPVKHPIAGAWLEFWVASVPVRLISEALTYQVSPTTTGLLAAADNRRFFVKNGGLNIVKMAYDLVTQEYFQRPGETAPTIDGVMQAPLVGVDWMENLQLLPAGVDDTKMPEDLISSQGPTQLSLDQERTLIEASDYRSWTQQLSGVDPKSQSRPHILRYLRSWALPQNVIDPATGAPRSAHFYDVKLSLEKRHRVSENSIVLVLACWRPLMFKRIAEASYLQRMIGLKEWLPPVKDGAWSTILANDGVFKTGFGAGTDKLVFDRSDVFVRGESFINCADADTPYPVPQSANGAITSTGSMRGAYASSAEIDALFASTAAATDKVMHYQAIAQTRVLGHVKEVAEV